MLSFARSTPATSTISEVKKLETVPQSTISSFLFVKTRLYWLYPANPKEG